MTTVINPAVGADDHTSFHFLIFFGFKLCHVQTTFIVSLSFPTKQLRLTAIYTYFHIFVQILIKKHCQTHCSPYNSQTGTLNANDKGLACVLLCECIILYKVACLDLIYHQSSTSFLGV